MRALVLACVMLAGIPARADDDPAAMIAEARDHFARKEFAQARALLLDAYRRAPDRDILFALGQVELGLGNAAAAIPYYERFLATSPPDDQAALAQQAIGVARGMLLAGRTPPPPRSVTRRRPWDVEGTGLVALGGAAIVAGAGLVYYGHRLADDASGTLTDYDKRLDQARVARWIGAGVGAAGALLIAAAIVRWRVSTETIEVPIEVAPTATGATVSFGGRW